MPISFRTSYRSCRALAVFFAGILVLGLLFAGCGETYRPVANPITKPGGDPQATHYAMVINSNDGLPPDPNAISPSVTQIDVSGDVVLGNHTVGKNPIHLSMSPGLGFVYVLNADDNTLVTFSPFSPTSPTIATIPLVLSGETTAGATFVASSPALAFVAETGQNRVAIVDGNQVKVRSFVPVGVSPVWITNTSDGRKLYVSNQGSNTVSVISTIDDTNQTNIPVGSSPGPIAISNDSNYIFVANQGDGTVSEIDTTTDTVVNTITVGSNPSRIVWDNSLKRVYVLNTGSASVSIIDTHALPAASVLKTVTTSPSPVGVAALANGSKFYVLFQGSGSGTSGTVEVYDAQGFYKRATVTVGYNALPGGALPALNQQLLVASPDSTKVYAVNYYGDAVNTTGSTSVIRTLDDSVIVTVPSPAPNPTFVGVQ